MVDFLFYINSLYNYSITQNLIPQVIFCYIFFLIIKSKNIFYTLVLVFVQLILFGVFIAYNQMELYTGFLWVAEFSVILVFLILLIFLNTDGYIKYNYFFNYIRFFYTILLLIPFFFFFKYSNINLSTNFLHDYISLWDDYYEALNNTAMNDFNGLFLSYYVLNSFEFLMFAFLLLFCTFLCVCIFRIFFIFKVIPYSNFLSIFNFFSMKINYNFIRQQNLHKQTNTPASNRVIKKK